MYVKGECRCVSENIYMWKENVCGLKENICMWEENVCVWEGQNELCLVRPLIETSHYLLNFIVKVPKFDSR